MGSHTALTTRQLGTLLERHHVEMIELDVARLNVEEVLRRADVALRRGDVAIATSRALVRGDSPQASLALSRRVAAAGAEIVRRLAGAHELGWVIVKGGITSSEVARQGLGARRAWVLGQLFAGLVPVWRLEPTGLVYVVFPGNVGDDDSLAAAVTRLKEAA